MRNIIVTTSWDDGNKLDLKLAGLLEKYKIKGTFYVSPQDKRFFLSEKELKQLAEFQELGAHTLAHPHLTKINQMEAKKEIIGSKEYLENLLGKEIKMFCYPYGEFNEEVKNLVKMAGFLGARTTEAFCLQRPVDFLEFGTTIHIYPFPLRKQTQVQALFEPLQRNLGSILRMGLPISSIFSWTNLAKNLFDHALKNGEIYHLFGHSWEIDKYGMWSGLEEILKYIAARKNIRYLTNSQVLEG